MSLFGMSDWRASADRAPPAAPHELATARICKLLGFSVDRHLGPFRHPTVCWKSFQHNARLAYGKLSATGAATGAVGQ